MRNMGRVSVGVRVWMDVAVGGLVVPGTVGRMVELLPRWEWEGGCENSQALAPMDQT